MKRLILPIVMVATVLAAATPAFAQSKDLAGSWMLDAEKSATKDGPPKIVLTLTDKEFTARLGGDTARADDVQARRNGDRPWRKARQRPRRRGRATSSTRP